MLCNECLGSDKAGYASANYYTVLKATFVVLDVACIVRSCIFMSWLRIARTLIRNHSPRQFGQQMQRMLS